MNVVVTGASRGVGFALVQALVKKGVNLIFAVSRDGDKLENLKQKCSVIDPGVEVIALPFDLTSEQELERVQAGIKEKTDRIDVLVNNAGALLNLPFEEISLEAVRKLYEVNVHAPFRLTQLLLPFMKGGDPSHVVNVGSMGGVQGSSKFPGLSAYSSSKGAVATLSECLAEELSNEGVRVNCLALGAVQTEMLEEAFPGYQAPLSAEQMASFIATFALEQHHFVNGKVIPVSVSTP